jgi:hypothetical protein
LLQCQWAKAADEPEIHILLATPAIGAEKSAVRACRNALVFAVQMQPEMDVVAPISEIKHLKVVIR